MRLAESRERLVVLRSIITIQSCAKAAGVGPFLGKVVLYLIEDSRDDDEGDRRHLAVLVT